MSHQALVTNEVLRNPVLIVVFDLGRTCARRSTQSGALTDCSRVAAGIRLPHVDARRLRLSLSKLLKITDWIRVCPNWDWVGQ